MRFTCKKAQFINYMERKIGVQNLVVQTAADLESILESWLAVTGHVGIEDFYKLEGCEVNGEDITIGLGPTEGLIRVGFSEPDRQGMITILKYLQEQISFPPKTEST